MSKPRIVILGGGYAAVGLVGALRNAIRKGEIDVTVVNRESYHVFHGFVAEMITGSIGHTQILSPVRRIFRPAAVHIAEIEGIDFDHRLVHTNRPLDGRRSSIPYDHLVLALGSADNLDAYAGLAEHAFRLKTYDDCFRLRNHILAMLEMATIEQEQEERERLLTFFIAGGGYAGTEMAGELADHIRTLIHRDFLQLRGARWRVVLVTPSATLLPELYGTKGATGEAQGFPELVAFATRHLVKLGVEIVTNVRVTHASPGEVGLSNGARIAARTLVSAVGTRPSSLVQSLDLPKDASGKIRTDEFLRVPETDYVWAAGDCAAVPHPTGGTCPPLALYALELGKRAGKNILRSVHGQMPEPFQFVIFGQGINLGRRTAVAEVKGVQMKGVAAWVIGRLLLLSFVPSRERRIRTLLDWALSALFGRDIVEMSVADADDYEIEHHVFQAGETILSAGYTGRYQFVITEGEAESMAPNGIILLRAGDACGRTRRRGENANAVRAKTMVRAVSLRYDQVHRLREFLPLVSGDGAAGKE